MIERADFSAQQELDILREFVIHLMSLNAVPDLCWYVAQEVVGRLGFDDCVVYLYDDAKEVLIQEAAIGLKNPIKREIKNKLVIPLGKGITGEVALTKKPILITDAAADARYIPDVMEGLSEICVPLLHNGEVLGVIDCEEPRKNYFTDRHLETLTAIASIASAHLAQCLLTERNLVMRKALEEALNESEKAQEAQSAFLANVSHELRTPLNAIVGFSALMRDKEFGGVTAETAVEYGCYINDAGTHLTNIVNDILDISALASTKAEVIKVDIDVAAEIEAVMEIVACKAAEHSIKIEYSGPHVGPRAMFDRRHFKQILTNLVDNAVKYSPDGDRVIISVGESRDSGITISVEDFGMGVSATNLRNIFEPFRRGVAAIDRRIEGSGLGLSLVRELATANGAKVTVTSELNKGSTFSLHLPGLLGPADPKTAE